MSLTDRDSLLCYSSHLLTRANVNHSHEETRDALMSALSLVRLHSDESLYAS